MTVKIFEQIKKDQIWNTAVNKWDCIYYYNSTVQSCR